MVVDVADLGVGVRCDDDCMFDCVIVWLYDDMVT